MATGAVTTTLSVAQLAATLSGVPFAAGSVMALQMINTACSEVAMHKRKSSQLIKRCTSLLNFINEQSPLVADTDLIATFDEAEAVLFAVHRRVQKWAACGKLERFFKSAQIAHDLDMCNSDVNIAMEQLHVANPVAMLRMQKQSIDMMQQHQAALEERLQQLLISPREIERAVQRHLSGGSDAYDLMRLGQERLVGLREYAPVSFMSVLSDGRQVDHSPTTSRPSSPITTVQTQLEQALLDLHKLTNIPPTIPILNNQIKKVGDMSSVRAGLYSQIFEGRWLGEKKVALKTIRVIDEHDPRAKRLQKRFENEITVWSKLKHENVLTMLGIVTNMGPVHIVSPWHVDNVRNYRYDHPDINPLEFLNQAAKGLEYLHDQQIVHGNLKCSNMLVSEERIVSISDFGLTQVLTEVIGKQDMVILSSTHAIRWQAPELNEGEDPKPSKATDVFAFGMCVLELLTLKAPYSHRLRDVTVLRDLLSGELPLRPDEPAAMPWMTDALWEALLRCWKWNPEERMPASQLPPCLEHCSEALKSRCDG